MGIWFLWQRMRDSNPRKRSQSPVCYRYTNPLFGTFILYPISRKCQGLFFLLFWYLWEVIHRPITVYEMFAYYSLILDDLESRSSPQKKHACWMDGGEAETTGLDCRFACGKSYRAIPVEPGIGECPPDIRI